MRPQSLWVIRMSREAALFHGTEMSGQSQNTKLRDFRLLYLFFSVCVLRRSLSGFGFEVAFSCGIAALFIFPKHSALASPTVA